MSYVAEGGVHEAVLAAEGGHRDAHALVEVAQVRRGADEDALEGLGGRVPHCADVTHGERSQRATRAYSVVSLLTAYSPVLGVVEGVGVETQVSTAVGGDVGVVGSSQQAAPEVARSRGQELAGSGGHQQQQQHRTGSGRRGAVTYLCLAGSSPPAGGRAGESIPGRCCHL